MVYEIHTYGGGDFLVAVLNGVNLLLGGSAYLTLIKAMALLGLIFFIGWIVFSFRFQLSWLLWFALAYLGFFVPKVDVAVIDHLRPGCHIGRDLLGLTSLIKNIHNGSGEI